MSERGSERSWIEPIVDRVVDEVFDSHELVRIVENYRILLAETDYGRIDFTRGIRNDRRQRVA